MPSRRTVIATAGSLAVTSLAGCVDAVLGDGIEAKAEPAAVAEQTAAAAKFERASIDSTVIERQVEVAGSSRHFRATTWITMYDKVVEDDSLVKEASKFVAVSTPGKSIAGQQLNPLVHLNNRELLERFSGRLGGGQLEDVKHQEDVTIDKWGTEMTVSSYDATFRRGGSAVEVTLYVGKVAHESDVILPIGIHHRQVDEAENIYDMIRGLEHPVEAKTTGSQ
ncbi:MAG: DUF6517 family protein [Halopenitus sp.]